MPQESVWKAARDYSEQELEALAHELVKALRPGDRILLEGPLGAGKTTLSRQILLAMGIVQPPEGSPTFAIAHQYDLPEGSPFGRGAVHVDLYRITSEDELEERGIPEFFWDPERVVLCEWSSLWNEFSGALKRSGRNWKIELRAKDLQTRTIEIKLLFGSEE